MSKLEEFQHINASYNTDNTLTEGNIIQLYDKHNEEYDNEGYNGQRWFSVTLYNTKTNTKRVFEKMHDGILCSKCNALVQHIFIAGDNSFGILFKELVRYNDVWQDAEIHNLL